MEYSGVHPFPHKVPGASETIWAPSPSRSCELSSGTIAKLLSMPPSSKGDSPWLPQDWSPAQGVAFDSLTSFLPALLAWSLWFLLLEWPAPTSS